MLFSPVKYWHDLHLVLPCSYANYVGAEVVAVVADKLAVDELAIAVDVVGCVA